MKGSPQTGRFSLLTLEAAGALLHPFGIARKLRVQYPEALDHVLNRGDRLEPIFRDDLVRAAGAG